jgi:hypothetical protein
MTALEKQLQQRLERMERRMARLEQMLNVSDEDRLDMMRQDAVQALMAGDKGPLEEWGRLDRERKGSGLITV